jgi:hypothetical protein
VRPTSLTLVCVIEGPRSADIAVPEIVAKELQELRGRKRTPAAPAEADPCRGGPPGPVQSGLFDSPPGPVHAGSPA